MQSNWLDFSESENKDARAEYHDDYCYRVGGKDTASPMQFQIRGSPAAPTEERLMDLEANDDAIQHVEHILKAENYDDMARQFSTSRDVESLIESIVSVLSGKTFVTEEAKRRARLFLIKLGSRIKTIPSLLFLQPKDVTMESVHSIKYGEFAGVYKGKYSDTGAQVSLKRIRSSYMDSDFCGKALAWRTLSHRHVLPFMGIYADASHSFISLASPYMNNGTLGQWRRECVPPVLDIRERILEVAEGLRYLHCEGIVHGDLCGDHVLLDNDLHVKIADFGLVHHSDSTATRSPSSSFHFTAPELFPDWSGLNDLEEASPPTAKTDVYAFGCLYYEIHFDTFPFGKNNLFVIGKKVKRGIRPERRQTPPLDDQTWKLMERCWNHNPAERPSTEEIVNVMASW